MPRLQPFFIHPRFHTIGTFLLISKFPILVAPYGRRDADRPSVVDQRHKRTPPRRAHRFTSHPSCTAPGKSGPCLVGKDHYCLLSYVPLCFSSYQICRSPFQQFPLYLSLYHRTSPHFLHPRPCTRHRVFGYIFSSFRIPLSLPSSPRGAGAGMTAFALRTHFLLSPLLASHVAYLSRTRVFKAPCLAPSKVGNRASLYP